MGVRKWCFSVTSKFGPTKFHWLWLVLWWFSKNLLLIYLLTCTNPSWLPRSKTVSTTFCCLLRALSTNTVLEKSAGGGGGAGCLHCFFLHCMRKNCQFQNLHVHLWKSNIDSFWQPSAHLESWLSSRCAAAFSSNTTFHTHVSFQTICRLSISQCWQNVRFKSSDFHNAFEILVWTSRGLGEIFGSLSSNGKQAENGQHWLRL